MRWLWTVVLVVLLGCSLPAQVEPDMALEARVAELNGSLQNVSARLAVALADVNRSAADIRKYDLLYEQKVDELRVTEAQFARVEQELVFERTQRKVFEELYATCIGGGSQAPLATGPSYDDLMRQSDMYAGRTVEFTGDVLQVSERDDGSFVLRVATKDGYDDVVWVEYHGQRVLEGDLVVFNGPFLGLITYTAVLGNSITLPEVRAGTLTVVMKAGDR